MLTVLLTNDDGVASRGLQTLRRRLISCHERVVTVAPARNCSGLSRGCTFATPVAVTLDEGGRHPVYSVDGTPADAVRVALLTDIAPDAVVVVSGINRGANLGSDVHYSGTVAAGLEAAGLGVAAVCVSQQAPSATLAMNDVAEDADRYDYTVAAEVTAQLLRSIVAAPPSVPLALNVNVPAVLSSPEPAATVIGRRNYTRGSVSAVTTVGRTRAYYLFGAPGEPPDVDGSRGTDFAALASGRVSVSPLATWHTTTDELHAVDAILAMTGWARLPTNARMDVGA